MRIPSVGSREGHVADPVSDPQAVPAVSDAPPGRGPIGYVARLWRAELPLSQVFWRDMVVIGTSVNLAAMGLAFLAAALGASTAASIAIFMAPLPYNILLVMSVWRRGDVERSEWVWPARVMALAWLLIAFVV